MKYCIFGGTFDPITKSHVGIIAALSQYADTVIVPINLCSYYRKNNFMFTFDTRKKLVEEACASLNLQNVIVSDIESSLDIDHRYIDTLLALKKTLPKDAEVYTVIGADSYNNFKSWASWEKIIENSKLLVIPRQKQCKLLKDDKLPFELLDIKTELFDDGSGTEYRKKLLTQLVYNAVR